jgi:hypothetical protein
MSRRMQAMTLLVGGATALACGEPYSNDDLLFSRSVPADDRVMIDLPARPDMPSPTETAQYYLRLVEISDQVNRAIFDPLATVRTIAAEPPTRRDDDTRMWGPIATSTQAAFTLYMVRTTTAGVRSPTSTTTIIPIDERFDFALYGTPVGGGESLVVISGTFAPLTADGKGVGSIAVDLDNYRRLARGEPDGGQYLGYYDDRDGLALELGFLAPPELGPMSAYYSYRKQGEAVDFLFHQRVDLSAPQGPPISALESTTLIGRWRPDQQGRADQYYDGGDIPFAATGSECWDGQFRRVYFGTNTAELGPSYGAIEACAPDLRTPVQLRR